jgi:uroporphyrinogen decarboxylase
LDLSDAPAVSPQRPLPRVLAGEVLSPPPIWLMRQAGRYLPEYRATRAQAGSFLNLCYTPALAAEVTLQPIRRYGFDAAILFSDILVVPDALGQPVSFVEGEGPRLAPIRIASDLSRLQASATRPKFARVFEAVARLRQDLPDATSLIGFCGAPWTVATYMVAGRGTPDQAEARLWAYRDPAGVAALLDLLCDVSIDYLSGQVEAGADLLQIFDSWAGSLPDDQFRRWVIAPTRRLVGTLKARHPGVAIIGFPRGAGPMTARYVAETGVDGVSCDTTMPLTLMAEELSRSATVQGNLDPLLLLAGGEPLRERVEELLAALAGKRFIFNLGHGIVPETPPEHVARLVELVRARPAI